MAPKSPIIDQLKMMSVKSEEGVRYVSKQQPEVCARIKPIFIKTLNFWTIPDSSVVSYQIGLKQDVTKILGLIKN